MAARAEGDLVWVRHPAHVWTAATVSGPQPADGSVVVFTLDDKELLTVAKADVLDAHKDDVAGADDLLTVRDLHEASILWNLRTRLARGQTYTWIGPILVFINPYGNYGHQSDERVQLTQSLASAGTSAATAPPPHVYATAAAAYANMMETRGNQTVVITGESGAGKTTMARYVIRFLTAASAKRRAEGADDRHTLEDRIVLAGPIMEAFGNAQTVRNRNSSRFGKYMKVLFNAAGMACGAHISIYLLEKARVISQDPGERNFHVFYQLLVAASGEERRDLRLKPPQDFAYLNKSKCYSITNVDDAAEYFRLTQALQQIGIEAADRQCINRILAAVLHLGNIVFAPHPTTDEAIIIKSDPSFDEALALPGMPRSEGFVMACRLLALVPEDFRAALTVRNLKSAGKRGTMFEVPLSVEQAVENRDAMVKTIYGFLFQWLVGRINGVLRPREHQSGRADPTQSFIGILDIFGFEIFEQNRLDQLCINYCNERLQQFFNQHVFQFEQEDCAREGIDLPAIKYSDNAECLRLIDGPNGIFSQLQEEGALPRGSDTQLLAKLHDSCAKHPNFVRLDPRRKQTHFGIAHYAGEVVYEISGFLGRNRSATSPDLLHVVEGSKDPFVRLLFGLSAPTVPLSETRSSSSESFNLGSNSPVLPTPSTASPLIVALAEASMMGGSSDSIDRGGPSKSSQIGKRPSFLKTVVANSVTSRFVDQLNSLLSTINATRSFYIRCIRSNYAQESKRFDAPGVFGQLRASGIFDCVRIRTLGFPSRWTYDEFCNRYGALFTAEQRRELAANPRRAVESLLSTAATAAEEDDVRYGRTKVFLAEPVHKRLETQRATVLGASVVKIQHAYRRYARRKQLRRVIAAVVVVQHAVLRRQALRRINQLRHERNRREAEARAPSRSPDGVRPGSATLPRPPSTHFVDQAGHELEDVREGRARRGLLNEAVRKTLDMSRNLVRMSRSIFDLRSEDLDHAPPREETNPILSRRNSLSSSSSPTSDPSEPSSPTRSRSMTLNKKEMDGARAPVTGRRSFESQSTVESDTDSLQEIDALPVKPLVRPTVPVRPPPSAPPKKDIPKGPSVPPPERTSRIIDPNMYLDRPRKSFMDRQQVVHEIYKEKFLSRPHDEFLCANTVHGPTSVSSLMVVSPLLANSALCTLIVRTGESVRHYETTLEMQSDCFGRPVMPELSALVATFRLNLLVHQLTRIKNPALPQRIVAMEERQLNLKFKFGVLQAKQGQTTEAEFMQNTGVSDAFERFVGLLGDKVELQGWTKFRAGLDVKTNLNGTHSIYSEWQGLEIMFHVANMMPLAPNDPQQLERKRHIGNDIVLIVFCDDFSSVASMDVFRSHQNHVVYLVMPIKGTQDYKIRLLRKREVPKFEPLFPRDGLTLKNGPRMREMLLYLLVSAERSAYRAAAFATRINKTRRTMLEDLCKEFLPS